LPFALAAIFFLPLPYTAQITVRTAYIKVVTAENSSSSMSFSIEEVDRVEGSLVYILYIYICKLFKI
jgi:hypothetical protein